MVVRVPTAWSAHLSQSEKMAVEKYVGAADFESRLAKAIDVTSECLELSIMWLTQLEVDMKAALARMREYCTHTVLHPQKEREDEIFYELINVLLILEREPEARAIVEAFAQQNGLPEQAFPGGLIAYVMEWRVCVLNHYVSYPVVLFHQLLGDDPEFVFYSVAGPSPSRASSTSLRRPQHFAPRCEKAGVDGCLGQLY